MTLSVQLYTLRDETKKDFQGALEKVAQIGYEGVEFAGYGDIEASRMKSILDGLGLKATGSHVPIDLLEKKLDYIIDYNLEIGSPYVICPYAEYKGLDDYVAMAAKLNKIGEACNKKGLRFCYHNHAHEFEIHEGRRGMDVLFGETEPELLLAEIDTYWVKRAGLDPVAYIEKFPGRCPIVHLKDMEDTNDMHFAEVGSGIMDIKGIVEAGKKAGAEIFVVEQDVCKRPPMESITMSYENIRRMNIL